MNEEMIEDDEMVRRVEAWLEAHPSGQALDVRETLSDCAEFLSDINGDLALRCEAALSAYNPNERLREALDDLQQAEFEYRLMHDRHGEGASATGRAWDLMRRAGDKARSALSPLPQGED